MNEFTKQDIKNSVEYQWRKSQIKLLLCIFLIVVIATFIIVVVPVCATNIEFWDVGLLTWLICMAITAVFFGIFMVMYHSKNVRLLNHFEEFTQHEVVLDRVATGYLWRSRGAVYYIVRIEHNGSTINVDTSPCFSSNAFAKFTCDDYNNKKVVGLYDEKLHKFYIIKKVEK